jgi:DNA-binding NtrC family response regulator
VFPIVLPPLRDHPEDIPQLVWSFITRHQRRMGRHIERVMRATMDALRRDDWPGNVRELQNVVERAMIGSTGDVLETDETLGLHPNTLRFRMKKLGITRPGRRATRGDHPLSIVGPER